MKWYFIGAVYFVAILFVAYELVRPSNFKAGDCIVLDYHYEKWQEPVIEKVIEVGDEAYRTIIYCEKCQNFYKEPTTESRYTKHKKVTCPK